MLSGIVRFFFPDILKEEVKKFSLFAVACFFTLGTYWILRLLKDVLIYELAFPAELGLGLGYGRIFIPSLKLISLVSVLLSVFIYSSFLCSQLLIRRSLSLSIEFCLGVSLI